MNKIFFNCVCKKKYYLISHCKNDINISSCSNCHSYYTKKKNFFDNSERIKKFNNKYNVFFKK